MTECRWGEVHNALDRELLFAALPDPVVVLDPASMTVADANAAAERLFGWTLEEKLGISALELVHHDDVALALASVESVAAKETGTPIELRVMSSHGWKLVELIGKRVQQAELDVLVLALRDLSERRRWEIAHSDNAAFRAAVNHAGALLLLVADDTTITSASAAVARDLGHDPERIEGHPLADLVHLEDQAAVSAALEAAADTGRPERITIEARLRSAGGRAIPYQLQVASLGADPTIEGFVVAGHDITQLDIARRQLTHNAQHDTLTGLLNRGGFLQRFEKQLATTDRSVTLAFIDLDRFKPVNDRFGHAVGDRVLASIARRIAAAVRGTDYIGRIGGDEFALVVEATESAMVSAIVTRVQDAIAEPMTLADGVVSVSATIGTAEAAPGANAEAVLSAADHAMYELKGARRARTAEAVS